MVCHFVDEELGFCHVRVPTWLPCHLQICLNGHNWLADRLRQAGIEYRMADNAFTHIADWEKAQTISDSWEAKRIHERLNELVRLCCPIYRSSLPRAMLRLRRFGATQHLLDLPN
jgi:hypothetical protein